MNQSELQKFFENATTLEVATQCNIGEINE